MSKRRRNRPSEPKPAQTGVSSMSTKNKRVNGESSSVGTTAELTFTSPSPLASSGEMLPPAPLPEPASAMPCEATQKSVMIERTAPIGRLMEELEPRHERDVVPVEAAKEGTGMDSFPPLVSSEYEEARDVYPPSVIARRRRARKVVGVLVGAAALFFAFGVGKSALASRGMTVKGAVSQSAHEATFVRARMGESISSLARSMSDIARQVSVTKPSVPIAATPPEPAATATDPAQGAKLRKQAESLLNRGKFAESIDVSRAAIAADPSDATSYLMLGTALQSTGKWKEGIAAYSDCVRNARRGPVHECSAVGGRK